MNLPPTADNDPRIGWIATFVTTNKFFYRGKLLGMVGNGGEPSHYRILDIKSGQELDLLINAIETIKWEAKP